MDFDNIVTSASAWAKSTANVPNHSPVFALTPGDDSWVSSAEATSEFEVNFPDLTTMNRILIYWKEPYVPIDFKIELHKEFGVKDIVAKVVGNSAPTYEISMTHTYAYALKIHFTKSDKNNPYFGIQ